MKKKILIGTLASIFAATVFYKTTKHELRNWTFADMQTTNDITNFDIYSFDKGKVKVNKTEVGTYSRFYNSITIHFYEEVNKVKEVKGKINSKVNITLFYPKQEHELRLYKG